MRIRPRLALLVFVPLILASCRREPPAPVATTTPAAAHDAAPAAGTGVTPAPADHPAGPMAHGDHRPQHGGLVLMNGDVHFEVVLDPGGHHQVYFTDEVRTPLPASIASNVTMTITRRAAAPEEIPLSIDDTGEGWVAAGQPVHDPEAIVRVTYEAGGKPYFIDLPWTRPVAK